MFKAIGAVKAACGMRRVLIGGIALSLVSAAVLTAMISLDFISGSREALFIKKKPEMIIIEPRSRFSGTRIV